MSRRPSLHRAIVPQVESLETRALLSAAINGDELKIVGTSGDDLIRISLARNSPSKVNATINGTVQSFSLSGVHEIKIYGLEGNDNIGMDDANGVVSRQTRMSGGTGDDTL